MEKITFPSLELANWLTSRDLIQSYAQVMGKIRRALTPPQKHWGHVSLRVTEQGLVTPPIPAPEHEQSWFEIILDLIAHKLMVTSDWGVWWEMPITGQPPRTFANQVLASLESMRVFVDLDRDLFSADTSNYDPAAVEKYAQVAASVQAVFARFKSELPGESSPVQLWPHHFDLALSWYSGRLVPGIDPEDHENADEQMTFGFSTGDEGIPNPYFYVTAYPWQPEMTGKSLPTGAMWHTEGWKGGLLMYSALLESGRGDEKLLNFLRATHLAGSDLMR